MLTLCALLFAATVSQTVGGGPDLLRQWNGTDFRDYFGNSIADAGDVTGDG